MYHCAATASGRPETPQEVEERNRYAKVVYDNNLKMINKTIQKKGIFRVTMNSYGEVILIEKTTACRPLPGTFTLICKGLEKNPEFGSFDALTGAIKQCLVVRVLIIRLF